MGSISDWDVMKEAEIVCNDFGVEVDKRIFSAHRTPAALEAWVKDAPKNGINVIIAGAGGAAHLAGVAAAFCTLPVIGVPIKSRTLEGIDSLLSIVQMPAGIPVATVGINGSKNAALLAMEILALQNPDIKEKMIEFRKKQEEKVLNTKFPE